MLEQPMHPEYGSGKPLPEAEVLRTASDRWYEAYRTANANCAKFQAQIAELAGNAERAEARVAELENELLLAQSVNVDAMKADACPRCLKVRPRGIRTCTPTDFVRRLEERVKRAERRVAEMADHILELRSTLRTYMEFEDCVGQDVESCEACRLYKKAQIILDRVPCTAILGKYADQKGE